MVERPLAGAKGNWQNQFSLRLTRAMRDTLIRRPVWWPVVDWCLFSQILAPSSVDGFQGSTLGVLPNRPPGGSQQPFQGQLRKTPQLKRRWPPPLKPLNSTPTIQPTLFPRWLLIPVAPETMVHDSNDLPRRTNSWWRMVGSQGTDHASGLRINRFW